MRYQELILLICLDNVEITSNDSKQVKDYYKKAWHSLWREIAIS
jgi:hypothetical protein